MKLESWYFCWTNWAIFSLFGVTFILISLMLLFSDGCLEDTTTSSSILIGELELFFYPWSVIWPTSLLSPFAWNVSWLLLSITMDDFRLKLPYNLLPISSVAIIDWEWNGMLFNSSTELRLDWLFSSRIVVAWTFLQYSSSDSSSYPVFEFSTPRLGL